MDYNCNPYINMKIRDWITDFLTCEGNSDLPPIGVNVYVFNEDGYSYETIFETDLIRANVLFKWRIVRYRLSQEWRSNRADVLCENDRFYSVLNDAVKMRNFLILDIKNKMIIDPEKASKIFSEYDKNGIKGAVREMNTEDIEHEIVKNEQKLIS